MKGFSAMFLMTISGVMSANVEILSENRPNIIFILADDLGKEWIEYCGADIKTPNINYIGEQGIYFNRAYSMPQSTPSRVALMTGQYPYRNGWINHYDVPRWGHGAHFDIKKNTSFPKYLKKAGYKTCVAGKWQLNDFRLQPNFMNDLGFDEYFMWTGAEKGNEAVSEKRYWDPYIHTKEGSKTYNGKFGPDLYSDFIIDFITKNRENPFFVYYPMTLTHGPLVPTPLEPSAKTNYERHTAMVRYLDFIIGKILNAVRQQGILENTYIFFTTDNGTSGNIVGRCNDVYIRGGKTYLSENGINAPFFVMGPDVKKGTVTTALIDFTDIYPTLLDLGGAEYDSKEIDGKSFVSVLKGESDKAKQFAVSMGGHGAMIGNDGKVKNFVDFRDRVVIGNKYKIYLSLDRQIERIYDLLADPYEKNNLINNDEIFKAVKRDFDSIIISFPSYDENPKYVPIKDAPFNESVEKLNNASMKKRAKYKNKMELANEEDYIKFRNKK